MTRYVPQMIEGRTTKLTFESSVHSSLIHRTYTLMKEEEEEKKLEKKRKERNHVTAYTEAELMVLSHLLLSILV